MMSVDKEIPAGFWKFDIEEGAAYHNPVLKRGLGYMDHEFEDDPGCFIEDRYPRDWRELMDQLIHYSQQTGEAPFSQEIILFSKTGIEHHLFMIGRVTAWNLEGLPIKMEGTHMDVTRRTRLEPNLGPVSTPPALPITLGLNFNHLISNVQGLADTFLQYCPAIVAMVDREMKYLAVTKAWRSQFKLDSIDLEGKSHYELFPDTPPIWRQYHLRAMGGETISMEEDSIVDSNGNTQWMQWQIRPWYDTLNEIGGILIYIIMVTDKHAAKQKLIRAKEQAEQAAEIKSRFLSVMSHEMRTPLNGVIGFINLLLQDPRPDQLENMNVLKFSAENLLVLINNVLDFNKLDADKVELEVAGFDLYKLLENIAASLKLEANTKHLELILFLDKLIPRHVSGDSLRLGQVLINLLSNAIKFTQAGKVSLIVTVVSLDANATTIAFAIEDTGIGIPQEIQDKIFDHFSQADAHTSRQYGGTGLGLTISKRIVQLMGGNIHLESQPGQGSVFSFEITFENYEGASPKKVDEIHGGIGILNNARILIVEDYPINTLVVKKFLQQWGCVPIVAENGLIAFEMVQKEDFDLVLMDLQMPIMNGFEATTRIRGLYGKKYSDLPIIAITASSVHTRKTAIFQAGMNGLVSKPFVPQQLQQLLVLHLSKR